MIRRSGGNNLSLGRLVTRTVSREPEPEHERTSTRSTKARSQKHGDCARVRESVELVERHVTILAATAV